MPTNFNLVHLMMFHLFADSEERDIFHKTLFESITPFVEGTPECKMAVESVTLDCATASELLHELTLSGNNWDPPHTQISKNPEDCNQKDLRINKNNLVNPWYFRGQANSEWNLSPKPWRKQPDPIPELREYSGHRDLLTNASGTPIEEHDLLEIESDLLTRYERTLENSGVSLLHLTREEKQRREETQQTVYPYEDKKGAQVIGNNITPLIAQHHGLPTRLLDLTSKPFVAAFMACRSFYDSETALEKLGGDGKIAIWALSWESIGLGSLNLAYFGGSARETDFARSISNGRFTIEYPSAASDERIKAQGGLFTYPPFAKKFLEGFKELPSLEGFLVNTGLLRIIQRITSSSLRMDLRFKTILDHSPSQFLQELSSGDNFRNNTFPYFRKLTLPYSEVHKLMECLDAMGLNENSLFPGIQQAANTLRHRTLRNRAMGCEGGYNIPNLRFEPLHLSESLLNIRPPSTPEE